MPVERFSNRCTGIIEHTKKTADLPFVFSGVKVPVNRRGNRPAAEISKKM
jgi:hypothetical protein